MNGYSTDSLTFPWDHKWFECEVFILASSGQNKALKQSHRGLFKELKVKWQKDATSY